MEIEALGCPDRDLGLFLRLLPSFDLQFDNLAAP
jgi:hypothetical protein